MARGLNEVNLLGNVGKDPEVRATQGGMVVANFSLATADRKKQGDQWVDHTEWHSLVALGRTAEIVRDYVKKGSQLLIKGKLQTRSWDDKQSGQTKYRTEILILELYMVGSRPEGSTQQQSRSGGSQASGGGYGQASSQSNSTQRQQTPEYGYEDQGITDDDIPF